MVPPLEASHGVIAAVSDCCRASTRVGRSSLVSRISMVRLTASSHEIATPVVRQLASTDLSHGYTDILVERRKRGGKVLSPGEIRALHVAHRRELVRRAF
jgi:hypothetical protein